MFEWFKRRAALHAARETSERFALDRERVLRKLVERAYGMMEMAGYRVSEHDPNHNNPIIAWMADARTTLAGNLKPLNFGDDPVIRSTLVGPDELFEIALNVKNPKCHAAADAFWEYWKANGETHKHGYYESTWGAINAALRLVGVKTHNYPSRKPPA